MWKKIRDFVSEKFLSFQLHRALTALGPELCRAANELERREEFEVLQILGARLPQNADALYDYYSADLDGEEYHRFTLDECRAIIGNDKIYDLFTMSYLHAIRNTDRGAFIYRLGILEEIRRLAAASK